MTYALDMYRSTCKSMYKLILKAIGLKIIAVLPFQSHILIIYWLFMRKPSIFHLHNCGKISKREDKQRSVYVSTSAKFPTPTDEYQLFPISDSSHTSNPSRLAQSLINQLQQGP